MFRFFFAFLALLLVDIGQALCAGITQVEVIPNGNEARVVVKGEYGSYRATGLRDPARLVLEFYRTELAHSIKKSVSQRQSPVRLVELLPWKDGARLVVYSRDPKKLFFYTLEEREGALSIQCGQASGKQATVAHEPALAQRPPSIYSGQRVSMDFYKTDIHNVMRVFGEITGKNIVLDERVKGEVTISLKDVPWDQALDMILDANNLVKEEKNGVVVVRPIAMEGPKAEGALVVKRISQKGMAGFRANSIGMGAEAKIASLLYQGRMLETQGERLKAMESYENAYLLLRSYPESLKTHHWVLSKLVDLSLKNGFMEKAYHYSKELLSITDDPWAAHVAAIGASILGREAEARMYFGIALSGGQNQPDLLFNYANFLEDIGDKRGALEVLNRYEQEFGPEPKVGLKIARLYSEMGDRSKACERYKELALVRSLVEEDFRAKVMEGIRAHCREGGRQ